MPYKTWATGDVPTAADFNALFSDPQTAYVATAETTTSTNYTDLATVGPSVTLTMVNGQTAIVFFKAKVKHSTGGGQASRMSYAVSGATTQAASDNDMAESPDTSTGGTTVGAFAVFTATATGSHTFTLKYRVQAGGTGTWQERRIIVLTR